MNFGLHIMHIQTASKMKKAMLLAIGMISLALGDITSLSATQNPATSKLAQQIAMYYTQDLPSNDKKSPQVPPHEPQKVWQAELPQLSEQEQATVLLERIFSNSPAIDSLQACMEPILNNYAWHDLKLFRGTESAPKHNLLARINRTSTALGKAALAIMLATPTKDMQVLQDRQQILKTLLKNEPVFKQLRNIYQQYSHSETGLLSFWSDHDPLFNNFYQSFIHEALYFNLGKTRKYNKSSKALEFRKRIYFDLALALHGTSLGFQAYYAYKVITDRSTFKKITAKHNPLWIRILAWYPGATIPIELLSAKKHYESWATPLLYLATRIADIQKWLIMAQKIDGMVAEQPDLEQVYGKYLTNLRKLLNQPPNTELGKLVHQLIRLPLKNWSVFFNNSGKLLQSYQLLLAHKNELNDALYDFGRLDAFLSTTQLLQEVRLSTGEPAYSFTEFQDQGIDANPYIQLQAMWNPLLDAKKAVPNSITMQGAQGGVRNMILTGPNAAGKSVFLAGIATSLLLSQTLGIAPAHAATITPFHKISTYLDISDDIAQGKSLFMAEVQRAQAYLNMLASLKKEERSFSVMDEIFSGTNPKEGEAAAYSIVHYIAQYVNSLHIVATHFPKLTLLPKKAPQGNFANYKVSVNRKTPQGKLQFTYQVEPGQSTQTIALDILEEQNYNSKILQEAKDILMHPENYQSNF